MDDTARRYRQFDTSLVADALDARGVDGVITDLDPLNPDHVAVGRARPLRFEACEDDGDRTNFPNAMFDAMAPGRVLVMDAVPDASCWGGNASKLAAAADLAGVVADGRVRDADDIRAGEFPVFSAGTTPLTGQRRTEIVAVDEPVEVDGVRVAPDDVVVADLTGVVVVPAADAEAVADDAADRLDSEREIERAIDEGATHEDLRDREF